MTINFNSIQNTAVSGLKGKLDFFNRAMETFAAGRTDLLGNPDLPVGARLIRFSAVTTGGLALFPFVLLPVNPKQLKVQHKKKSNYQYTLGGFVLNHWHDDLTTITATGYIPSMMSRSKPFAASYWAFLFLLNLYKSNGQIVTSTSQPININIGIQESLKPTMPQVAGGAMAESVGTADALAIKSDSITVDSQSLRNSEVQLAYQNDIYTGIFLDFTIEEDEEQPNTLLYSFTFISRLHTDVIGGMLGSATQSISSIFG